MAQGPCYKSYEAAVASTSKVRCTAPPFDTRRDMHPLHCPFAPTRPQLHAGQALMLSVARSIKTAAQRTGCAAIITNSVDSTCRPLGGKPWARQAHYTALVSRPSRNAGENSNADYCTIQLHDATYRPAGAPSTLPFTIARGGAYSQEPD